MKNFVLSIISQMCRPHVHHFGTMRIGYVSDMLVQTIRQGRIENPRRDRISGYALSNQRRLRATVVSGGVVSRVVWFVSASEVPTWQVATGNTMLPFAITNGGKGDPR